MAQLSDFAAAARSSSLPHWRAGAGTMGRMERAIAILCFFVGSIFAALFLLLFVTKIARVFSQLGPDLAMLAFGLAAFGCYRAGLRFWKLPAVDAERTP
jgi:hypothetical protein